VGCAASSTEKSRPISRAITIFCWLPPERARAGSAGSAGRMSKRLTCSAAWAAMRAASSEAPRAKWCCRPKMRLSATE
jgi:hypothetical protein